MRNFLVNRAPAAKKDLFTFNQRLRVFCKLVEKVKLVMHFLKWPKLTEQIFVGKESNESTVRYGVRSRIPSCLFRYSLDPNLSRFSLVSLICLCMLTLGVGNAWGEVWIKVTSAPTSWAGEYLLVYESSSTAGVAWTGVDAASCNVAVSISSGVISTKPASAVSLTVEAMTGGYSILINGGTNNGKYLGKSTDANGMDFENSAVKNTFAYSSDCVSITGAGKAVLRYNNTKSNYRFRYFKSSTYSSQQKIQLYKKAYTVTYNKNGGTGNMTDSNSPYTPGSIVTVKTNEFVAPAGKTFDNWNTQANGSGNDFVENATFTISKDTTFYAQWKSAGTSVSLTKAATTNGSVFLSHFLQFLSFSYYISISKINSRSFECS